MRNKFLFVALGFLLAAPLFAHALTTVTTVGQGGTGSTTLSGILRGNGTSPVRTVLIGAGLTFNGTTLSSSGGSASSTLLGDTNTWSGNNAFNNTITGSISGNAGTVTNGVYTTSFNSLFDARFITNLAATTSVKSITTLPTLSLPYSQLTGAPLIASTTLLSDSNTFSGTNSFSNPPIFSSLTGVLKGNGASALTAALNGTDFTLITARTCTAGDFVSAVTAAGSFTCTTPSGAVAVGYPFPLSGNATSTLTQFNAGLTAYASSTIGSGAQNGGLTISGGATTTGNLSIGGYASIGPGINAGVSNGHSFDIYTPTGFGQNVVSINRTNNTQKALLQFQPNGGNTTSNVNWIMGMLNSSDNFSFSLYNGSATLEKLSITDTGNVGIGSTTPAALLGVQGNELISGNLTAANIIATGTLSVTGQTTLATSLSGILKAASGVVSTGANGTDYTLLTANTCGAGQFFNSATAAGVLGCAAPTGSSFSYPFPLLGLGTTSPIMLLASTTIGSATQANGLTVNGGATTTLDQLIQGKLVVSGSGTSTIGGTFQTKGRQLIIGGSGATALPYIPTGGGQPSYVNLIGADSGQDTSVLFSTVSAGNSCPIWEFGVPGDTNFHIKSVTGCEASAVFLDRYFINGVTGAIGYGTSVPTGALEVATSSPVQRAQLTVTNKNSGAGSKGSAVVLADQSGHTLYFGSDAGLNGGQNGFINYGGFGTGIFIDSSANIAINTTSPAANSVFTVNGTTTTTNLGITSLITRTTGNALCIIGTLVVTAGNTTCTTSSKYTKHDISSISDSTAQEVMALRPVQYVMNEGGDARFGLIAEEVNQIDPRLVETAATTTLLDGHTFKTGDPISVDYIRYTGLLTAFVQYQQREIEALKPVTKTAEDNWQWIAITLLVTWNIWLTFRRRP